MPCGLFFRTKSNGKYFLKVLEAYKCTSDFKRLSLLILDVER